jgi:hypothetical protein
MARSGRLDGAVRRYLRSSSREHADTITQRISTAHPFWRLWLPACFYTNAILLLQLRVAAAGVVLTGLLLMLSALAALVYHPWQRHTI